MTFGIPNTHTLVPFLVGLIAAAHVLAEGFHVAYKASNRSLGFVKLEAWRSKASALARAVSDSAAWLVALLGLRAPALCAAVLLALLMADLSAAHAAGIVLATAPVAGVVAPTVDELRASRTKILAEANAMRAADGSIPETRAAEFGAKLAEVEAIDAQVRTLTPAAPAAAPAAPAATAPATETRDAILAAERTRVADINTLCRTAKLDQAFADRLVSTGSTIEAARGAVLTDLTTRQATQRTEQHTHVTTVADASDKFRTGVAAWLMQRAGLTDKIRQVAKDNPEHAQFRGIQFEAGEFRGMSMLELARQSLELAGVSTRGMDKQRMVSMALSGRDGGGMQTTSDFSVALENTLNKVLLAFYKLTPDTWTRFCAKGSVSDFRPHPRYRLGFLSSLDALNEAGEFKNKSLPDAEKESITASTKGNIIALSRKAIINDDMGIFSRVAVQMGRAAKLSIERSVYALLAENGGLGPTMGDSVTLFHADHNNVGTGVELSVSGFDEDRMLMAQQTDPSGNEFLDLRPAVLLVPIGLGGQARTINAAEFDTDAIGSGLTNKFMVPNKVRGLYRDIVDTPRISGTRRYSFADPNEEPVIEVAFLDGVEEPYLEMQDGWRTDGVEWKERLDYAVGAVDYRGAVTDAGTT